MNPNLALKGVQFLFSWGAKIVAGVIYCYFVFAAGRVEAQGSPGHALRAFLEQQKQIRILVVDAPAFGHQMTAVSWVYRIRELGFRGEIELVLEPNVLPKLKELMPELPWPTGALSGDGWRFPDQNLRLISAGELRQGLQVGAIKRVNLAIVPAEDWFHGQSILRQPAPNRPTPKEDLGANNILRMQPMTWRDGYRSLELANGEVLSLEDMRALQLSLPKLSQPSSPNKPEIEQWLSSIQPSLDTRERQHLAQLLADEDVESLPFYCGHVEKVLYLSRLSLAAGRLNESKAIRIWVLTKLTDFQWQNLKVSLRRQSQYGDSFAFVDIHSGTYEKLGAQLVRPNIELIRVDPVAPALMRYISAKATLPPAITGKYSQSIMLQLGRPFLELKYFDDLQEILQLSGEPLAAAQAISREINEHLETAGLVQLEKSLANFWRTAKSPEALRQFGIHKISVDQYEKDLIFSSLKKCADLLSDRP